MMGNSAHEGLQALGGLQALEGLAAPAPFARDEAFVLATRDERTDDETRLVSLDRRHVRIVRRRGGVSMHIGVPSRAYRGVALSLSSDDRWCITLTHADPALSVPLASAPDDTEILACWRGWSRFFDLPALVEVDDGEYRVGADPQAVAAGRRPAPRRRGRIVADRRPRFLLNRKTGVSAPSE